MRVTIFQTDVRWASPEENVANVQRMLDENQGSDLYVLPEMWATGFATEPHDIAEGEDSVALRWMRETAVRHSCAVSGSLLIAAADGTYRNRHYFVSPDSVVYYDKHHLFSYGHEDRYITAGTDHVVVNYRGVSILLLTCYDLRFPMWSRYGIAGVYDMIVVVANWPDSRQQAWRVLTRARAIENQCYLVGANRVGDDSFCHYIGESLVCDSKGDTLVQCGSGEQAATVSLDMAKLRGVRERFRVLEDRDEIEKLRE